MSESASVAELDAVADALYALKPDEFSAARDAEVRTARAAGNQPLARELGKLRKPTQSAWLINLLWRDQHDVIEQLFELARELGRAQAEAAGPELRALTAQRREIETALVRRAVELARAAGVRPSDSVTREAQETLSAALAVPEVADEVRSGRLVKAATYAGFGGLPAAGSPPREARGAGAAKPEPEPETREPINLRAAQRAREEREQRERRERLQRQLEHAQAAADKARADVQSSTQAADAARGRASDVRQQVEVLRERLGRLESDLERAEHAGSEADARRGEAEAALAQAERALADAQTALNEPGRDLSN